MILRRLYLKNKHYSHYFHPELDTYSSFIKYLGKYPEDEKYDNAEYIIDKLTHTEQKSFWSNCIKNIMFNTRWLLDNLESFNEFKVRWNYYGSKRKTVGKPPTNYTEECEIYNHI